MDILPIFVSAHTIGESILTLDEESEIKADATTSIFAIAKVHSLPKVCIVDEDISGYWRAYDISIKMKIPLVYGIKLSIVANLTDKTPESNFTESKIVVLFKNSKGYEDFIVPYSEAATTGVYNKERRLDWQTLQKYWTPNLILCVPFYSSFLARNLTRLNHRATPSFGNLSPVFFEEEHGHPYDEVISPALHKYCEANKCPIQKAHTIYYYNEIAAKGHLTIKCLHNRSSWDRPNLENFYVTETFSFEEYLKKTN